MKTLAPGLGEVMKWAGSDWRVIDPFLLTVLGAGSQLIMAGDMGKCVLGSEVSWWFPAAVEQREWVSGGWLFRYWV